MTTETAPPPPRTIAPADRLDTLPPGLPRLTLGHEAVHWAETNLIQPNGPRAGKPFRCTPRQIKFYFWWYAVDEDGRWEFGHGARRLPKGFGKSPSVAVLGLVDFLAPVRVHDIDHARGIVVGKPVEMPLVQIAATAESQTGNTMRMVRAFAGKSTRVAHEYGLDVGKLSIFRLPEGKLECITSSATAAEGQEPSLVVEDETEHWLPNNGGDELAATIDDNLAKSGSRAVETSNAWIPGQQSVAEATWGAWLAQEEGRTVPEAGRILYDARVTAARLDWADAGAVRKDLQRVYSDAWWADIDAIMARIYNPKAKLSDSKRKYGNRPTVAEDAWVDPEQYEAIRDLDQVVAPGTPIAMFFDGSKSRDATALLGCRISDGFVFTLGIWEPDTAHDTVSTVDVADVDRVVRKAKADFEVVGFFGDVREFESFVLIDWPKVFADSLLIKAVPGGRAPQAIAWDMRTHTWDFTRACELTEAEIREGRFRHDGNAATSRHVANARRRPNRYGVSIGKESEDSPLKIDGAVGVVGVRLVRRQVLASPEWKKRSRRTGRAQF